MERGKIPVIGISGGSAAGKTTLTAKLAADLEDLRPVILNQDLYFRVWDDDALRTSNHPRAVLWERLVEDVGRLAAGGRISGPIPGGRPDRTVEAGPGGVLLVEGHLLLGCAELAPLLDLKVFLDVDPHERVLRRMLRDVGGGTGLEEAVAWYRRDVLPNYPLYTAPGRDRADVVLPDGGSGAALGLLAAGIRSLAVGAAG